MKNRTNCKDYLNKEVDYQLMEKVEKVVKDG
jgi:hypothetical protein